MLIPLAEYARRIGKTHQTVLQKVKRGTLPAQRIGTTWMIDEDEPYIIYSRSGNGIRDERK